MAKKKPSPQPTGDRFAWLAERLEKLDAAGLRRRLVPRLPEGLSFEAAGRRLLNFGTNDYLGLAAMSSEQDAGTRLTEGFSSTESSKESTEERFKVPAFDWARAITGAGASPLVTGYTPLHDHLCQQLARFERAEAAVLFPSGFAACSGVLPALAEAGDLILSDALNHASLIDGCRLSKAERYIYPHRDIRAVEQLLLAHRQRFQRVFLVTDSVFSMDGTIAPLEELADLADRFDVIMVVDEAHATGVLGPNGGGVCDLLGLGNRIPVKIGTLSKALGASGGFVAGPSVVIDTLLQRARPLIYSTASPPSCVLNALRGLHAVVHQPERRERLLTLVDLLIEELRSRKIPLIGERTPIIPVIVGEPKIVERVSLRLTEAGYFVPAIRPPTVPEKTARLRISLSACHSEHDVLALAGEIASAMENRSNRVGR